ncbi:hypothetical protein F2Q69_00047572 [Brassica cretica]|uniref:Uncharacterized protein n=1 Tax=Brassica cretica TaxID=69181 RepID=A0A8S9PYW9_BRACR|nr:hypothetical protein F2Q69_00047572 [Brassica cretica]
MGEENNWNNPLLLDALTARMNALMDQRLENFRFTTTIVVSEQISIIRDVINLSRITSSGTMGEENNRNNGMDPLLLDALTARMNALMDQRLENSWFTTTIVVSEHISIIRDVINLSRITSSGIRADLHYQEPWEKKTIGTMEWIHCYLML